ncbi:MAG: pyruvoyl-dependent arginine decarboxylase [Planctomycetota bacterium]|jgi:arginine decarboxylase
MNNLVPTKVFLTKGVGWDKYQLKSFEQALRKAGVAGEICYCVMARVDTNEHGRLVASSVGIAIPKDNNKWGYLSEVHGHGMNSHMATV